MKNRKQLESILEKYYIKIHFDKATIKSYKGELLTKHDVLEGMSNGVLMGIIKLNTLSDEELFWFAETALLFKNDLLQLEDYYSDAPHEGMNSEIAQYSASKIQREKKLLPIKFKNVLRVSEDQFVTTITAKQLAELYRKQLVVYNIWTQRDATIRIVNGVEVPTITINKNSVNSIAQLLQEGSFIPNTLSFNVREENFDKVTYDEGKGVLTLNCPVDILDGAHRASAIIRTVELEPEFDLTFVLNIMTFTEKKAQRFIAQEDKRNKISKSYVATLDSARMENRIVSRLNEDEKFCFFGQIKPRVYADDKGKVVFDSGKLIDIIGASFHPRTNTDIVEIEEFLCKEINALTEADKSLLTYFSDTDLRTIIIYYGKHYGDVSVTGDTERTLKLINYFRENPSYARNRTTTIHYMNEWEG